MDRNAPDPGTFADALAGAWRCIERVHAAPNPVERGAPPAAPMNSRRRSKAPSHAA